MNETMSEAARLTNSSIADLVQIVTAMVLPLFVDKVSHREKADRRVRVDVRHTGARLMSVALAFELRSMSCERGLTDLRPCGGM